MHLSTRACSGRSHRAVKAPPSGVCTALADDPRGAHALDLCRSSWWLQRLWMKRPCWLCSAACHPAHAEAGRVRAEAVCAFSTLSTHILTERASRASHMSCSRRPGRPGKPPNARSRSPSGRPTRHRSRPAHPVPHPGMPQAAAPSAAPAAPPIDQPDTQTSSQLVRGPWMGRVWLKDGFERRPHTICGVSEVPIDHLEAPVG